MYLDFAKRFNVSFRASDFSFSRINNRSYSVKRLGIVERGANPV